MTDQENITRIRVHYAKGADLRFTGHLDMQRLWERLLRRSGLPIRYSQGYNPRARLNLASALPLGFTSGAELLDFWMDEPVPVERVQQSLSRTTPPGLTILEVKEVPLREDALQVQMAASEFEVHFFDIQNGDELNKKVQALLDAKQLPRTRRKKAYDLRPLILDLQVTTEEAGEIGLWMRLRADSGGTGRPDEVLDSLEYKNTDYLVKRSRIILSRELSQ
jgi:radical SAM-linked protein